MSTLSDTPQQYTGSCIQQELEARDLTPEQLDGPPLPQQLEIARAAGVRHDVGRAPAGIV